MSLVVNVAQLLKETVGSTRRVQAEGEIPTSDGGTDARAKGTARLVRTDEGVWVEGSFQATAEAECSRCLVPFGLWVTLRLDEVFLPTVDVQIGRNVKPEDGAEEHFTIDEHHTLDLTEAVRQYTTVAMPLKPLCGAHCQGFCPQCGTNLNEETCGCRPPMDPRWEPLKRFLVSDTDE